MGRRPAVGRARLANATRVLYGSGESGERRSHGAVDLRRSAGLHLLLLLSHSLASAALACYRSDTLTIDMSTVSDLTTAFSGVSLSRRSTTFANVSSDGQRFDVDSAVLAFHSKIFADMFETVGESNEADRTCDLAEDGATVKAFLEALLKGIPPSTEEAWLSVFSLMDKYECKALKTPLLLARWCVSSFPNLARLL